MEYRQFDFYSKLLHHEDRVRRYVRGERISPINVEIDLTNGCNHRCKFCQWADYIAANRVSLPTEVVLRTLKELAIIGVRAVTWTGGGEPMLHKGVLTLLDAAHGLGLENGLLTNGSLLQPDHDAQLLRQLAFIRVSMGGGDRQSYRAVQGRDDFDRIIANLERLAAMRRRLGGGADLGVAMLVTRDNAHTLVGLAERLARIGVDYLQVREDMFDDEDARAWWQAEVAPLAREAEARTRKAGLAVLGAAYHEGQKALGYPHRCHAHHFVTAINAEGYVCFCKNTRDKPAFYVGNLYERSFTEIWQDSAVARSLEARITPRSCATFCKNMEINRAAEDALQARPRPATTSRPVHADFL